MMPTRLHFTWLPRANIATLSLKSSKLVPEQVTVAPRVELLYTQQHFTICQECMKKLFKWKPALVKEADINGWTPLHYAARFCYSLMVRELLLLDKSVAYLVADNDDKKTALHIAASRGFIGVMKNLLTECPDCWEMLNDRGQNILHIAIESEEKNVIEYILGNPWHINLINQKDADGNTPMHLFAASNNSYIPALNLDRVHIKAFNKENLTPFDVATETDIRLRKEWPFLQPIQNFFLGRSKVTTSSIKKNLKDAGGDYGWRNVISKDNADKRKGRAQKKEEIEKDIRKIADTHLIVATLIATVTFAAGFTMPGGYSDRNGSNQGMAILTEKATFWAFVITNTIAMISSSCAVFLHFVASGYVDKNKVVNRFGYAIYLIIIAMVAMVLAFITGMYVVLAHSSILAITTCTIGCLYFLLLFFVLHKAWKDF
uniref:Putative ankyrin-1-like n=1 Tax=Davidia involucrata TaxID=16924 RepID=A0A5B6YTQ0_DAVIN